MQYIPEDIKLIKEWLKSQDRGFTLIEEKDGVETWGLKNKSYSAVVTNGNLNASDIIELIETDIKTIAKFTHLSIKEVEREVLFHGIHLTDVIPFRNDRHEGFILQWNSRIDFGEYTIFRDRNDEVILPWSADSECMDNENKRLLKELMRQFVESVKVI